MPDPALNPTGQYLPSLRLVSARPPISLVHEAK